MTLFSGGCGGVRWSGPRLPRAAALSRSRNQQSLLYNWLFVLRSACNPCDNPSRPSILSHHDRRRQRSRDFGSLRFRTFRCAFSQVNNVSKGCAYGVHFFVDCYLVPGGQYGWLADSSCLSCLRC